MTALGRCVKRVTNGDARYFAFDGPRAILEYDPQDTSHYAADTLYGLGVDEIIARNNYGIGQWFLQVRLGNTSAVGGCLWCHHRELSLRCLRLALFSRGADRGEPARARPCANGDQQPLSLHWAGVDLALWILRLSRARL